MQSFTPILMWHRNIMTNDQACQAVEILFTKTLHERKYRRLTSVRPPMWQAEAVKELTLSASPATAVGQIQLTMAKFC